MSDYRHLELEDDEYDETDHWVEDPIFSSIEEINTQIEEMKNFMSESKKRTEIQGTIIQEMRRRLSEAELVAEQQQKTIHDLSEQLVTVRTMTATSESPTSGSVMSGSPTSGSATMDLTISESAAATTETSMGEEVSSASEQTNEQYQGPGSDSENFNKMNLIDKILKLEAKAKIQNDLECKKSLLISNLGLDNVDLMRDNHYPKIRYFLRQCDLGFVLDSLTHRNSNVRLYKSGAIKIRYDQEWMARHTFNTITKWVKEVKGDRDFFTERIYNVAQNIKFSICTPPRFSRERRLLATEGMRLKNIGKIKYFDFIVIHGRLIMKTFQRLDGYQFFEAYQNQVKKTAMSSLNHKMGRHYVNVLNDNRGMPARFLLTPDRYLNSMNGGPLMINDDRAWMEARQRHAAMWRPTVNDRGMEPDTARDNAAEE